MSILSNCLISVVDDDESIRAAMKMFLRSVGYQVQTFDSAESFLNSGVLVETSCLILDIRMPGIDGLELQQMLTAAGSHVPVVFVTAHDDSTNRQRAIAAGAVGFLRKPFAGEALIAVLNSAWPPAERNRAGAP